MGARGLSSQLLGGLAPLLHYIYIHTQISNGTLRKQVCYLAKYFATTIVRDYPLM